MTLDLDQLTWWGLWIWISQLVGTIFIPLPTAFQWYMSKPVWVLINTKTTCNSFAMKLAYTEKKHRCSYDNVA